eukprot:g49840.t1
MPEQPQQQQDKQPQDQQQQQQQLPAASATVAQQKRSSSSGQRHRTAGAEGNIGVDGVVVAVLGVENVEGWIGWIVVEEELPAGCKVVGPVRLGGGMDVAPTAVPDGAVTGNDPAKPAVEAVTG